MAIRIFWVVLFACSFRADADELASLSEILSEVTPDADIRLLKKRLVQNSYTIDIDKCVEVMGKKRLHTIFIIGIALEGTNSIETRIIFEKTLNKVIPQNRDQSALDEREKAALGALLMDKDKLDHLMGKPKSVSLEAWSRRFKSNILITRESDRSPAVFSVNYDAALCRISNDSWSKLSADAKALYRSNALKNSDLSLDDWDRKTDEEKRTYIIDSTDFNSEH